MLERTKGSKQKSNLHHKISKGFDHFSEQNIVLHRIVHISRNSDPSLHCTRFAERHHQNMHFLFSQQKFCQWPVQTHLNLETKQEFTIQQVPNSRPTHLVQVPTEPTAGPVGQRNRVPRTLFFFCGTKQCVTKRRMFNITNFVKEKEWWLEVRIENSTAMEMAHHISCLFRSITWAVTHLTLAPWSA